MNIPEAEPASADWIEGSADDQHVIDACVARILTAWREAWA